MTRPLFRGDRLRAARESAGLSRDDLAMKLAVSSPVRIRLWELGRERPRPRFVPRLAAAVGVEPLSLLDVDADDPPLEALRLAAGLATNEMGVPGVSVMTYMRLEYGRRGVDPPVGVLNAVAQLLGVDPSRVAAAIHRSRIDHSVAVSFGG